MKGYDEDRPGSPVRIVLSDDDAAAPLMCPPYSEVVLCDGGCGRPSGAIHVYTIFIRLWEGVLEF